MIARILMSGCLVGAIAAGPVQQVHADAGDFIGGIIVGGLIGSAIQRENIRRNAAANAVTQPTTTATTTRSSSTGLPRTQFGRDTQTALNYFGYDAGGVDGQIGAGTRSAIQRYQATMGYPINGRGFEQYQYDYLMQAYYWGVNDGAAQTRLSGQALLLAYQQQLYSPAVLSTSEVSMPKVGSPATEVAAEQSASASFPSFFTSQTPSQTLSRSLAVHCNGVMLETNGNGGYTTADQITDVDFALGEQFCLGRSHAMAEGEQLVGGLAGANSTEIQTECQGFAELLGPQIDMLTLNSPDEVQASMREFALDTGVATPVMSSTAKVCLSIGYRTDNMPMAIGSVMMLSALGEPAYEELLGHHLSQGFGVPERADLAVQWYQMSLTALDNGAPDIVLPEAPERREVIREATVKLASR
jgi:peptidoglycan hydrolase-like protein with peptidoglycan-binding domain